MKNLTLLVLLLFVNGLACTQPDPGCDYKGGGADYLLRIGCAADFRYIKGRPLTEKFGYAESIKIVYIIKDKTVYFTNAARFPFHYEFCAAVLGNKDDIPAFNNRNYTANRNREYILCNLNYYSHLDLYALELMPEDDTGAEELYALYKKIAALTYFPGKIKMLVSSPEGEKKLAAIPAMPLVRADDIYKNRQFV